jgi:hypothetical protein
VATVVVAQRARTDLAYLIETRQLPGNTAPRVRAAIEPLAVFPQAGKPLAGRWHGLRVILGPWPWMLLVHSYDEASNTVTIVAIHDARSASAATSRAWPAESARLEAQQRRIQRQIRRFTAVDRLGRDEIHDRAAR